MSIRIAAAVYLALAVCARADLDNPKRPTIGTWTWDAASTLPDDGVSVACPIELQVANTDTGITGGGYRQSSAAMFYSCRQGPLVSPSTLFSRAEHIVVDAGNGDPFGRRFRHPVQGQYNSRFDGNRQCVLVGPSHRQSGMDGRFANLEFLGPLRDRLSDSVNREQSNGPTIPRLLNIVSPSAVGWRTARQAVIAVSAGVSSCIVDPVDAVTLRRPASHIGYEVLEAVPSCTHINSATAVILESFVVWVFTTGLCMSPDSPFVALAHTMSDDAAQEPFVPEASTARCLSVYKMILANGCRCAAIAHTGQVRLIGASDVSNMQGRQSAEFSANDVLELMGRLADTVTSHDTSLLTACGVVRACGVNQHAAGSSIITINS